tara:strand:+ start:613 stop:1401 length:789 start_codon:yes stop_codon:yes gene_type:complete
MSIFSTIAILGYVAALAFVVKGFFRPEGLQRRFIMSFAGIAVIMHGMSLNAAIFTPYGQNLSITNVVSTINWVISLAFTSFMFRLKIVTVVPAVYLCSILSVSILWFLPPEYMTHFDMHPEILVHVALSLVAYSILMISALYAIQLQITQHLLKQKRLVLNAWLPPLLTVEKHVLTLVMLGIVLLSLSLVTGFVFLDQLFGQGIGHKTVLSLLAWLIYVMMLWKHYRYGCTPRAAVIFTLSGGTLLTLAYFGARIVKEFVLV